MIIYGHRGAAGESPENTIASCKHAVERGVRHIEVDLQLSSDEEIVIIHDTRLKRTAGVWDKVNTRTAAEMKGMDARASGPTWPSKKHCGVPTLKALLKAVPELKGIELEIKSGRKAENIGVLEGLADIFPDKKSARGMTITCSNPRVLGLAMDMVPWIDRGYVSTTPDPRQVLEENDCTMLATHWGHSNSWLVRRMRKMGVHVSVWTVNDPAMIKALYKLKVDSVITDYPSMAVPLLSALER